MTDGVVVDASVVVAALLRDDEVGRRCTEFLLTDRILAPAHMQIEAASAIRGQERGGLVESEVASAAIRVVGALAFESWPFGPLANRIWELRANVSAYDAGYVALAELADLPLATLDRRLARASGPRCEFLLPA